MGAAVRFAAVSKVQAAARGAVSRRSIRATAAAVTVFQAYTRGGRVRNNLSRRCTVAVKMQSAAGAVSAHAWVGRMRKERRALLTSVVIQKAWRGAAVRSTLSRRTIAAAVLQR